MVIQGSTGAGVGSFAGSGAGAVETVEMAPEQEV
jgi:hypothetical protein